MSAKADITSRGALAYQPLRFKAHVSISGSLKNRCVYIGFGAIRSTNGQPFAGKAGNGMIEHMLAITQAIAHYVELGGLPTTEPAIVLASTACTCAMANRYVWDPAYDTQVRRSPGFIDTHGEV